MTKNSIQRLLEVLGEKIPCECQSDFPHNHGYFPIDVGDVAWKIAEDYRDSEFPKEVTLVAHTFRHSQVPELFELWEPFRGKSLQEICELDTEEARSLCEFLSSIFLNDK